MYVDIRVCLNCRKKARRESEEQYYMGSKASSLLSSEMEELSGVVYRPRTKDTRTSYELLLSFIQNSIGDQVCMYIHVYKMNRNAGTTVHV